MDLLSLSNRLKKVKKHLTKWARKNDISCYRLYERDIPEFPLVVDWYDGNVIVWFYSRKIDDTPQKESVFVEKICNCLLDTFDIDEERLFIKKRYRQKGQDKYTKLGQKKKVIQIIEQGITFEVNLSDYLDTGLFLDHRNTRLRVKNMSKGKSVLNLFAYTGAFTCYALVGGAKRTTTVDINKIYSTWTERNMNLNGFYTYPDNPVVTQDCIKFLEEHSEKYDVIVLDPPTFSNSKKMDKSSFVVDRDYIDLLKMCRNLLYPDGVIFFSNNYRKFEFDEEKLKDFFVIKNISNQSVPEDFRNKKIHQCWELRAT